MKRTINFGNNYITVGADFMISLLTKIDFNDDLLEFLSKYEEQNIELSIAEKLKF